ncbi:hypothetical protein ON010_g17825 [Phytophthora cinnamomi]|nr:hypothetical protein ON010_g17825 [Phytophthora cinnamomi]
MCTATCQVNSKNYDTPARMEVVTYRAAAAAADVTLVEIGGDNHLCSPVADAFPIFDTTAPTKSATDSLLGEATSPHPIAFAWLHSGALAALQATKDLECRQTSVQQAKEGASSRYNSRAEPSHVPRRPFSRAFGISVFRHMTALLGDRSAGRMGGLPPRVRNR